jgi:hypothetical protein
VTLYGIENVQGHSHGILFSAVKRWRRVISELARQVPDPGVLPFDERASVRYAEIVTDRERAGRPIGVADAQIAAICRDLGAMRRAWFRTRAGGPRGGHRGPPR